LKRALGKLTVQKYCWGEIDRERERERERERRRER
jgi:hypothetical protein